MVCRKSGLGLELDIASRVVHSRSISDFSPASVRVRVTVRIGKVS